MPRQRTDHSRIISALPGDFSQRLKRFQREPELSWAELRRRFGIDRESLRRWRDKGALPCIRNYLALLAVADSFDLGHLLQD